MVDPSRLSSALRSTSRRQRRLTVVALALFSVVALATCRPSDGARFRWTIYANLVTG